MSEADAGGARTSSDSVSAALLEPEPPRAPAPATRDVEVAAEDEQQPPPPRVRDADALRRYAESQGFGGDDDGEPAVKPVPEPSRAVPETGDAESPYAQAATQGAQHATAQPFQIDDAAQVGDAAAAGEKRGRVARVREGTRTRVENTRARVERVKDDARVALEDAPDDSGLRFVAVAVVLFVIFLALLLLSVTVLR